MRSATNPPPASFISATEIPARSQAQSPFIPVAVWLLLQLLALGISAGRIPFYAIKSFPQPAELLAMPLMRMVQIGGSAMLFPFLLRDARTAGMVIAASWPFALLAGILTGFPQSWEKLASVLFITVWLSGLALWRTLLRSPRSQAIGVSVATLLVFGGPLINYLGLEYGGSAFNSSFGIDGPVSAAIIIDGRNPLSRPIWIYAGSYLILACIAFGIGLFRKSPAR